MHNAAASSNLFSALINDEAGFIVSAELVLISTIAVLSMVVGLSEVAHGVNQELEDVGAAFGSVNQSFRVSGNSGHKGHSVGSKFGDHQDMCDGEGDISCNAPAQSEAGGY